jgi:glycosyltransferase involved in cell wall biosynthesis
METDAAPLISVVVPCRNEREHIADCVQSILQQKTVPGGFEIIIADGMSDDGTREILNDLARVNPRIRVIDNPQRTTSCALNAAIRHCRGKFIARMDAHNLYAPDYLCACLETIEETGADNVGGCWDSKGRSWFQKAIAVAHGSAFCAGGARCRNTAHAGPSDTVFGGFFRAEVFANVGGFDEALLRNQDDEFNLRLIRSGGSIWQSPRIKSWYFPRSSLSTLFRQYLQYGYWKVKVIQKHHLPASIRHLVPGAFAATVLGLPLLALLYPVLFWLWLGILALYGGCSVLAAALSAARKNWTFVTVLPVVFACYHLAYGFGFLLGVLDFLILRRGPAPVFTELTRPSVAALRRSGAAARLRQALPERETL